MKLQLPKNLVSLLDISKFDVSDKSEEFAKKYKRILKLESSEFIWCKMISASFLEPFSQTVLRYTSAKNFINTRDDKQKTNNS